MAIGVDTSKWKTRKITGTPANKFRNIIGVSVLVFGIVTGTIFHFIPLSEGLRKKSEKLYEDPVEEVERRIMIGSGLRNRSGDLLRKIMEEQARVDRPDS